MKKIYCIVLIISFLFVLSCCSKKDEEMDPKIFDISSYVEPSMEFEFYLVFMKTDTELILKFNYYLSSNYANYNEIYSFDEKVMYSISPTSEQNTNTASFNEKYRGYFEFDKYDDPTTFEISILLEDFDDGYIEIINNCVNGEIDYLYFTICIYNSNDIRENVDDLYFEYEA